MAKSRPAISLGPLEREVMLIVWARDNTTVQQAVDTLAEHGNKLAYTTVLTIFGRLGAKKLVNRKKIGKAFAYRPNLTRDEFENDTARQLAQQLIRGFDHLAIASFVEEVEKVGPDRLRELQALVEDAAARHDRQE